MADLCQFCWVKSSFAGDVGQSVVRDNTVRVDKVMELTESVRARYQNWPQFEVMSSDQVF